MRSAVRRFPNHPAIFFEGSRLSYRRLNHEANRFANALIALGERAAARDAGWRDASRELRCRHLDTAAELLGEHGNAMRNWLDELNVGSSVYAAHTLPQNATGVGLTEAPRGALAHWIQIVDGKIARYQVLTPLSL